MNKRPTPESVFRELDKGVGFNGQIDLYDTVKNNENFFIGKQWEGVQANGLPMPVFNFIKRIISYVVASTATDNIKISASALSSSGHALKADVDRLCSVVNAQFEAVFEQTKLAKRLRDMMRNAAVDGDGCIYTWFDPEAETGQDAKGAIRVELLENTRVIFGNPNTPEVQKQPYILVTRRVPLEEAREMVKKAGGDPEAVRPDTDDINDRFDAMADDKVTVALRFWRAEGTVHALECTRDVAIRAEFDTRMKLYPLVWLNWDFVQNCYHGQAAVTGLIPNQIFVNKAYAMSMISLMTTAYPKIVYDKTRVSKWSNAVGQAIGVNGGDVSGVAKAIDPATISPQVSQFIASAIDYTKEFMGATDAALGDTRPDNTSAIIALQKASGVPMELFKQNLFQAVEDLGNVWLDMMRVYYGERYVEMPGRDGGKVPQVGTLSPASPASSLDKGAYDWTGTPSQSASPPPSAQRNGPRETPWENTGPAPPQGGALNGGSGVYAAPALLMETPALNQALSGAGPVLFDFGAQLEAVPLSLKLDVGGSAYWSEIAQMQTLDHLLELGKIDFVDYLERVPNGYILKQQDLIEKYKGFQQTQADPGNMAMGDPALVGGSGYGTLQRKINETGDVDVSRVRT